MNYYTDVKISINAGMQFNTNNNKIRKIGYKIVRHFFDTKEKDCLISSKVIKQVIF